MMAGVFFFSSRRRHTRYWRDWSSDVCSSDLGPPAGSPRAVADHGPDGQRKRGARLVLAGPLGLVHGRVGLLQQEIGRASCRERGEISVVAVSLKKKHTPLYNDSLDQIPPALL